MNWSLKLAVVFMCNVIKPIGYSRDFAPHQVLYKLNWIKSIYTNRIITFLYCRLSSIKGAEIL